jgi:sigma-E factor negative regulatory protein RseA
MTVNQNEMLSALVDGELQGQELDNTLALLSNDAQAKQQFLRYQFASDVLHGNTYSDQPIDLTIQIAQAITNEPTYTAKKKVEKSAILVFPTHFWKQATGLAVAASIGALAMVGVVSQPQLNSISPTTVVSAQAPTTENTRITNGNRWTIEEPEIEDRLNTYLVDHNEYAGASDVFSYARVVSYDAGQ